MFIFEYQIHFASNEQIDYKKSFKISSTCLQVTREIVNQKIKTFQISHDSRSHNPKIAKTFIYSYILRVHVDPFYYYCIIR